MKIIELLVRIVNAQDMPKAIIYKKERWEFVDYGNDNVDYINNEGKLLFANMDTSQLCDNVETIEYKDIPYILEDELWALDNSKLNKQEIDFNFRVLKEKINQLIEELNIKDNS